MNYYKKNSAKALLLILLFVLPLWSCKKFVDIKPKTSLLGEYIFDNNQTIVSALNGAYVQFAAVGNPQYTAPSLFADELTSTDLVVTNNTYSLDNDLQLFDKYYATIYDTNYILEGIDNAPNISAATISMVKGEAMFLRALSYFQLVNYYGNVPFFASTDANFTANVGNVPASATYQKIIDDLKTASGLLSNTYPSSNRTRANKQTVNTLLAKVYLYTKDWANAADIATQVINSNLYSLNADLNGVYSSTSNETIFQLWNNTGVALGAAFIQTSSSTPLVYSVRPELANAFGPSDQRKGSWIQLGSGPSSSTYFVSKYKIRTSGSGKLEYAVVFRLAELHLIRAEALAQQNTSAALIAGMADLEITRRRAGLTVPLVINTSAQLLSEIMAERRKELCFELGNRWFDLNRTGQTVAVLSAIKPNIDSHITLLPYTRQTLLLNRNLKQNPGY